MFEDYGKIREQQHQQQQRRGVADDGEREACGGDCERNVYARGCLPRADNVPICVYYGVGGRKFINIV